jgi:hypothetical protein
MREQDGEAIESRLGRERMIRVLDKHEVQIDIPPHADPDGTE